jgi:hypothetical protein
MIILLFNAPTIVRMKMITRGQEEGQDDLQEEKEG